MGSFARGVSQGFEKSFGPAVTSGIASASSRIDKQAALDIEEQKRQKKIDIALQDFEQSFGTDSPIAKEISSTSGIDKANETSSIIVDAQAFAKSRIESSDGDSNPIKDMNDYLAFEKAKREQKFATDADTPKGMVKTKVTSKGPEFERDVRNIPEEKFDLEKQKLEKVNLNKSNMVKASATATLKSIGKIKAQSKEFGVFGNLPSIPGKERTIWENNVKKLTADLVINLMAEMKSASQTGATGFGQLNEKELQLLIDGATTLKRDIPEEEALNLLNDMENIANKVLYDVSISIGTIDGGYSYVGGDPSKQDSWEKTQ